MTKCGNLSHFVIYTVFHKKCIWILFFLHELKKYVSSDHKAEGMLNHRLYKKMVSFLHGPLQIRSNETAVWSIYEVKWVLFKLIFCQLKMLACPWPLLCSIPRVRAFKWGIVWCFISRGIKMATTLVFWLSSLLNKDKLFGEVLTKTFGKSDAFWDRMSYSTSFESSHTWYWT